MFSNELQFNTLDPLPQRELVNYLIFQNAQRSEQIHVGYSSPERVNKKFIKDKMQVSTKEPHIGDAMFPMSQLLFNNHNNFVKELSSLIAPNNMRCSSRSYYDTISDIVSEYDRALTNLPDDVLDLFFEYTDLLESVLLVSKRRCININDINDILSKLSRNYSKIYALIVSRDGGGISDIFEELNHLREEIKTRGLLPTVEECETEIDETLAIMNNKEKEDLARLLRSN